MSPDLKNTRDAFGIVKKAMDGIDKAMFAKIDQAIGEEDPADWPVQSTLVVDWKDDICTLYLHLAVNREVRLSQIDRQIKCRKQQSRDLAMAVRTLQGSDRGQVLLASLRVNVPAFVA